MLDRIEKRFPLWAVKEWALRRQLRGIEREDTGDEAKDMFSEPWAKKVAVRYKADFHLRAEQTAAILDTQKILNEHTDKLWNELKTAFERRSSELNQEIGREVLTVQHLGERIHVNRRETTRSAAIRTQRDPATREIFVSFFGPTTEQITKLRVAADLKSGEAYLVFLSGGGRASPDEVAKQAIENLLSLTI
ncbi:MAG TPA: hypothetical protein VMI06_18110 [Terriglobia bacterium]|nr:hypothetical protein [Terriglobia bacterium]